MARPTLFNHRKFRRLATILKSKALAVGHLELLWSTAYESGDPVVGDVVDVEAAACWDGDEGVLAQALLASGFIERLEPRSTVFVIHDFWHHAPRYVQRREAAEEERKRKGVTISDQRRAAALARWGNRSDSPEMQTGAALDATRMHADATPAPAPAPAPAPGTYVTPLHPTPHPTTRASQDPCQDPGALPPEPPVAYMSAQDGSSVDTEAEERAAGLARLAEQARKLEQWRPPPPATAVPSQLPGEDQLEALAAELFAMWPSAARGDGTPYRAQRALLDLLKARHIWPDGSPPDPMPPAPPGCERFGRSFTELLDVSRVWVRLWKLGDGRPWNLGLSYLGRGRDGGGGMCFLQDPPAPSNGRGRASPVAGTRQLGMPADILAAIDDGIKTTEGFEEWRPEDEATTANGART